ncbi:ADP-ribosylation factor-like protein 2-binding protein isoform X2 [Oncorhynchus nerka]|uniref:ADP-ribosylation factor-like protein 2-binding protein isoform X2 n=1 Tax=Oncorhynchus kisutch TaxID=8019 RepID=UPI00099F4F09|nr:ADP-ribosylation factor-like protein 2-binding protein isoform X2 [Oncorhynchus kisutch]XP_029489324.1 ADP-ribosylation factor-like protein 2-binding protein isoform X2 [Oncorhynchus nerka]
MDVKERNLLGGGENIVEMVDLDEENFAVSNSSDSDAAFDAVIGSIEDIIMEDDFQHMQQSFMEKHYLEFDDSEENKLTYTPIFNEYIELLEKQLEQQLMERIPGFNMSTFTQLLKQHKDEVSGDIFDMLLTFTDFMTFKEMFIDYRAEREGRGLDLSDGLVVRSLTSTSSKSITSRTTTKLK